MSEPDAPSPTATTESPRQPLPAKSLALVCALHAAPLGVAAFLFPFRAASWFTLVVGTLAALHVAVAGLALARRERELAIAWQILAVYSIVLLAGVTVVIVSVAVYLSELYRGIGRAIAAGLFGVWGLLVLFTIPIAAWGLARTEWPRWLTRRRAGGSLAVVILGVAIAALAGARSARAETVRAAEGVTLAAFAEATAGATGERASLFHVTPAACREPVDATRITLLLTTLGRDAKPFSACVQANDASGLTRAVEALLAERAAPGAPIAFDLVRAVQALSRSHPLFDALKVRPALDGVCGAGKCLAPWQLVALDAFTSYRPLDDVRDASFGCSLDVLARALGATEARAPLVRVETESVLVHAGKATPLRRMRPGAVPVTRETITRAVRLAEGHIVSAQQEDGAFRYWIDALSGRVEDGAVNLPRQAGTTLVLCELGRRRAVRRAVRRALAGLATYERSLGERAALSTSRQLAQLGHTALPLVAFASCRELAGDEHDPLIGRMARLLLAMQRDDGAFYPEFDLRSATPRGTHTPLYAGGQAVLALVLVEQLARATPGGPFPPADEVGRAVERAMRYYARDYWPKALRSLFYLEENWHCLAARAALPSHRNDDYERFCLDYVEFKARLILDEANGVDPDHVGGYTLSNMLPPHSTPTAGFGEALAAALSVKAARGLDVTADQRLLERVLGFLLRAQWTPETCFACAEDALGGFSESAASPALRIDYVQHAMAALGHGLGVLGVN